MDDLEQRVAALEGALNNLFNYTLPYWENKITNLESRVQDLENEIGSGSGGESILDKLNELTKNLSNLSTGNKKLITILMSYANIKLLSPKNPNADSALWVNLNELVGE